MLYRIRSRSLLVCLLLPGVSLGLRAQTTNAAPALMVTYIEAAPAKSAAVAAHLLEFARQMESGAGKPTVTVLKELGRPNRMVVVEQWPDVSSPAYAQAESALTSKVKADELSLIDRRLIHPTTSNMARATSTSVFVLMHVDIGPEGIPDVTKLVQEQGAAVVAAPGALGFETGVQDKRANHFEVIEEWRNRAAYESYLGTKPAAELRHGLGPFLGAPFDERLYSTVER